MFSDVERSIATPVEYTKEDLNRKIDANDEADLGDYLKGKASLLLQPLPDSRLRVVLFRLLAISGILWALLVITTETTLIAGKTGYEYTAFYQLTTRNASNKFFVFITSVLFLSGMTLSSLFTIFNLKISDFYQMCPGQTDCVQMVSIMSVTSQLVNVLCFNYLFICGEINKDIRSSPYRTSFVTLYSSMIETPFFGDWYQVIAPTLILLLAILFTCSGFFKYNGKTVEAIRLHGARLDTKASGMEAHRSQRKNGSAAPSFVERILMGEKAILKEMEAIKVKKQKRRLSVVAGIATSSFASDTDNFI